VGDRPGMSRQPRKNGDLDRTNDWAAYRRKRMYEYRQRTKPVRDRVRLLPLLQAGVSKGWIR
jgi:hypothetical protein